MKIKKGEFRAGILVLMVGALFFGALFGYFAFAETPSEEKARLEAELAQLEQQLAVISAGFGVNEVGL